MHFQKVIIFPHECNRWLSSYKYHKSAMLVLKVDPKIASYEIQNLVSGFSKVAQ